MTIEAALAHVAETLRTLDRGFALVGGLAVSLRAEVRFTRDVDLAVTIEDDTDFERLVFDLSSSGYSPLATVEQKAMSRLATVRLRSPLGFVVDLLGASSGIGRLQDRLDARNLLIFVPELDVGAVRADLDLITARGYHREQDLRAKLAAVLEDARR